MLLSLFFMMFVVSNMRGAEVEMTSFATVAATMDDYISYSTGKGGGTSNPAIYSEQIRLYQNSKGTGGGTITLEAKTGAIITEVTIGSAMATQIRWQVGESMDSVSLDLAKNATATLSGLSASSVTCHCWGTTSNTRLYVNYLKVVYEIDENATPDEGGDTPDEPQDEYWELVTDATSLLLDDQVVIVAKDIACALGPDKGNNRAQASVVKTDNRITLSEDVQILTLEPGTKDGTFALSTDSGYLYAASSISNQLKTKKEKDDDASWAITIADDIATIKAQGENERNWLRFNSSASVFSCYSSGQGDVLLYKHIVPGGVVSRPAISGDSIEFVHSTMVTIAAADSLDIYYTIDGSDPIAKQSIKYTGAFTLTEDVLVKAIAYNATTDKSSKMVSQQFYKIPTITCAEASAIALAVSGDGVLTERTYRIVAYVTGNVEPVSSGQQVFDVADTAEGESVFMSYYCQVPEGGVEIGMKVEMIGKLTKYNGVAEMKYGVVTILEGVPTMLYFIPNSNWKMADARFAAYLYGSTNTGIWVDMQLVDAEEGVYSFVVDKSQYDHVIFMRMNPATSENIWGNDWNRSADIVIPQDLNCATMMEDSWDGEVVWSNYGEDYVDVLEIEIANLATEEVEADGVTYLQLSGSDDVLGMNWLLFLSNYTGENKEYALDLENYYIGTDGIELTLLSGTLTKSTDVEKGDVFTGRIVASYDTEIYAFDLTMYSTSPILIKIENANVAIDEYNILKMTGNWLNEADGITYPVLVEVLEYNMGATEPYNVPVTITVGGLGDEDPWWGFAEGEATITVVDSVVTLTGVLHSWLGLTFDVTISGSLKGENVEELQTDTIYFVNMQYWNSVYVYAWNEEIGSVNAAWPGVAAANANYQVNGYDVYYFVANQGQYTHCIFNNSNAQTDNLQWTAGKYYYNGSWWTYDELMNNVVQSTYTVAGSSGLLGSHWDVADTTNNMTLLEDGIYQLIKTDLSLVAGTYEYKVVRDHSWDWCRPSGPNQVLSIDKDGIYTVTFTLDLSIETISATAELQQEAVVIPKVFLIGTMNDWDYTATELQLDSDSLTASVSVTLNANTTYDFQMVVDGNWFTSYDGMMTRDNSQNWQFEHIESSTIYASISTDIAGEYTFVWNYADNTVSVIYPDICSAVKELDWYNGVKVSQLQSSVWHKIDIASITEYATLTHIAIENDLWDQVNVSVEYYTSCDGFKIMQGEARFPVGVTNMELNFDEITKYIVYMPNIDGIYLKVSVEEVGYAFAWFEDFVCDGSVYVDPITGEAHVIMSSVPSSLYWEDVVQVHSTLDSIYTFYINPIVAPKTLDEYALKQIGAMPHLVAGQPVDTTGTAEAIMAYYQSIDRETVADVVRVEWVEGANDIVPCDADYYYMTLLIETACEENMIMNYEFPVAYVDVEEIIVEACGSYDWNGVTYTESGAYNLKNEDGCVVGILNLTILPIDDEITIETICYGETFLWEANGEEYTETTYLEIVKENEYGCAVTYILDLTVSTAPVVYTDSATICYGDYYAWIDGYYDETGVYETVIYNDYYCDSIIATLHLTVLPEVPETIEEITIYDGEEYMWHDEIYTEEGEYSITLQDINGCDSVVTLHLTVKPIYEDEWALLKEIREDLITNNAWQTPWDVSTSVSSWRGVELYNGHVIEIDLSSQGLMGTFPTKILQLPHLEYLSLADNQLTGDAFAKIQTDMTTFVATNPTFVSALTDLDISYNQFTGNVGIITAMSKLMPNLSTLQANNNRLKDVVPMIPKKIHVDLSEQDINHYVHLDLSNLNVDPMQLPTILLYDHLGQTYFTSPVAIDITNYSPNYTYKHDDPWGIMIDKTNDYLTCLNGEAYRGKNGDTLYLSYPYADVSRDSYCRMTLSFEMGDANFVDGVNVADLQSTILYAFGGYNNCAFNLTAADTYTDNRINVQDVIRTVDILLAKADINTDSATMRHIVSQARAVSYDAEIVVENNTIKLITNQPIAALQISAIGDVQWLLNGIGMEQTTAHQSVVAYSLAGNYIPAGEAIIGYCQGNVEITQAELSDAEARMVAVSISGKRTPTEMENIEQTTSEQLIYDVLGRKHDSMQQQGLYIIKSNNQYIKVYNHQ